MSAPLTVPIDQVARNLALARPHMEPWVHEMLVSFFNIDLAEQAGYDEAKFKAACQMLPDSVLTELLEMMKP